MPEVIEAADAAGVVGAAGEGDAAGVPGEFDAPGARQEAQVLAGGERVSAGITADGAGANAGGASAGGASACSEGVSAGGERDAAAGAGVGASAAATVGAGAAGSSHAVSERAPRSDEAAISLEEKMKQQIDVVSQEYGLTKRETEVVLLTAQGFSCAYISVSYTHLTLPTTERV